MSVLLNDTDPDGDPLVVTAVTQGTNGSVTIVGSIVTYTPDSDWAGIDTFTYTVSDGDLTDTATVTITVTPQNDAPTLVDPGDQTTGEGDEVALLVAAGDPDVGDTLTFTATGLPPGLDILPATGLIGGTVDPGAGAGSPYLVTITAADDGTPSLQSQVTLVWTVVDTNRRPIVDTVTSIAIDEGRLATFTVTASDPDGNSVVFSLGGAPSGASIDPSTGEFSWQTTEMHGPGTYAVEVVVTDDGSPRLSTTTTAAVAVLEVNEPPVIASVPDPRSAEGDVVTLQLTASDPDVPASALAWSARGLPPGLSIDPTTGLIAGTVVDGAGTDSPYVVVVTVQDGGDPSLAARASLTWTVSSAPLGNRPPIAAEDTYGVAQGETVSVEAPGVLGNDSDPDGDTMTVRQVTSPSHGIVTIRPDGSFTYTHDGGPAIRDSFMYGADDGRGGVATAVVTITLRANRAPVAVADEADLDAYTPTTIAVLDNDSDPDGDPLTILAIIGNPAGRVEISAGATLTYYPRSAWTGTDAFEYTVSDTYGNRDTGTVTVSIAPSVLDRANEITEALGTQALSFETPDFDVTPAEVTLELTEGVSLVADAFFQTVGALRLPLGFLALALVAALLFGGFSEVPFLVAAGRRRHWSVVMLGRESTLPVRSQPSFDADVIYRYESTAAGLTSFDTARGQFVPIDSPNGTGWADRAFLTRAVDLDYFMEDQRPAKIARKLAELLDSGKDFSHLVGSRGLAVSLGSTPFVVGRHRLARLAEARRSGSTTPRSTRRCRTPRRR